MSIPTDSIIVVRHAEPADQVRTAPSHWIDMDLTPLGRRQADCLADRLARELSGPRCRLYSSDLRRASQTAEAIAGRLGVTVQLAPQLREHHNGLAPGLTQEALKEWAPRMTPPMHDLLASPGGETWPQFQQRVSTFMERITAAPDRPVVVVAHNGTNICILTWWLRLELNEAGQPRVSFVSSLASIAVLTTNRFGKPTIERLNDASHLQAAGPADPTHPAT